MEKAIWRFLKRFFDMYDLDYSCFAEKYHWSTSTIRYWFIGRSLPQRRGILNIKEYLSDNIPYDPMRDEQIYEEIKKSFTEREAVSQYYNLRRLYPIMNQFAGEMLTVCYDIAKNKRPVDLRVRNYAESTGKTLVVVFDFDGTLTSGKNNRTTWESLWTRVRGMGEVARANIDEIAKTQNFIDQLHMDGAALDYAMSYIDRLNDMLNVNLEGYMNGF